MMTDWGDKIINLKLLLSYGLDEIDRLEKLYGEDDIRTLKDIITSLYRSPVIDDLNRANENYYRMISQSDDWYNSAENAYIDIDIYKGKCKKYRAKIRGLKAKLKEKS